MPGVVGIIDLVGEALSFYCRGQATVWLERVGISVTLRSNLSTDEAEDGEEEPEGRGTRADRSLSRAPTSRDSRGPDPARIGHRTNKASHSGTVHMHSGTRKGMLISRYRVSRFVTLVVAVRAQQ